MSVRSLPLEALDDDRLEAGERLVLRLRDASGVSDLLPVVVRTRDLGDETITYLAITDPRQTSLLISEELMVELGLTAEDLAAGEFIVWPERLIIGREVYFGHTGLVLLIETRLVLEGFRSLPGNAGYVPDLPTDGVWREVTPTALSIGAWVRVALVSGGHTEGRLLEPAKPVSSPDGVSTWEYSLEAGEDTHITARTVRYPHEYRRRY
jgi:hypothetical protein